MAYLRNNLVARRGYAGVGGLGGTLSDIGGAIKDIGGGALSFYGTQQQAVGAAAAAQAANRDLTAAMIAQQGGGIGMGTILIGAVAVGGLFLILRKKKSTP